MLEGSLSEIAVLDFGGQYTHLITKRIRRLGVLARIHAPEDFSPGTQGLRGIILSGGPDSVSNPRAPQPGFDLTAVRVPMLGLCYGHQLIAKTFGGEVETGIEGEYGLTKAAVETDGALFEGLGPEQVVWMSHRDLVTRLPVGFRVVASSDTVPIAGFEHPQRRIFGLQFHPEVTHTVGGMTMLDNFVGLCTETRDWTPEDYTHRFIERTREEAGDRKVILLVSGGVDSLVTLKLCVEALGPERVFGLHVDTGFMRLDESAQIAAHLHRLGYHNLKVVDASERFFRELAGKVAPEEKRKIVGRLFVEVARDELRVLGLDEGWMLAQGTIYPDTIESGGSAKADTIKTHHNRVQEIDDLIAQGRIIEPLRDLYKDEVRELGRRLDLPEHLLLRHPFPGPALVIRILCSDTDVPEAGFDREETSVAAMAADLDLQSAVLPIRSVGVQGDSRTYAHPALLWSTTAARPDWSGLKDFAARLVNAHSTVNRVVFSPGRCAPASLHLGRAWADREQADRLRLVDALVRERMAAFTEIWQLGIIALPLFDGDGQQVYVVRPVLSTDAMTADVFAIDWDLLEAMEGEARAIAGVGALWYDVTTKPPATIEWE
ncbi:MAG: glutamine-hydrolyzing GMP synthase [Pseudomonadota bacterium]